MFRNDVAHGFSGRMGFDPLFIYLQLCSNGEISSANSRSGTAATLPSVFEDILRRVL